MNIFTLIRPFSAVLIGSAALNIPHNDIDILICVPSRKVRRVERQLSALGFTRQTPQPQYIDHRVTSAWKSGIYDVQIAKPHAYKAKLSAHRRQAKRLRRCGSKAERYKLICN